MTNKTTEKIKEEYNKWWVERFSEEYENTYPQEDFWNFLEHSINQVVEEEIKLISKWFKFPYRKGMKVTKNIDGTGGIVNDGCEVCGGKLVFIRGKYPHTSKRKVCPTCATEILEGLYDNLVSFEKQASLDTISKKDK